MGHPPRTPWRTRANKNAPPSVRGGADEAIRLRYVDRGPYAGITRIRYNGRRRTAATLSARLPRAPVQAMQLLQYSFTVAARFQRRQGEGSSAPLASCPVRSGSSPAVVRARGVARAVRSVRA